jgi:putative DNA primase/helicase
MEQTMSDGKDERVDNIRRIQAAFPRDMSERDQFVCWRSVCEEGTKKPTKIPIDPESRHEAKTNDPTTWMGFARSARRYIASDGLAGVGFVFTEDDPYAVLGQDLGS